MTKILLCTKFGFSYIQSYIFLKTSFTVAAVTRPPRKSDTTNPMNNEDSISAPTPLHRKGSAVDILKKSEMSNTAGSESSDTESDYTGSDFVGGAFWELNRKTPVPTARHGTLPTEKTNGQLDKELDEGYQALKDVINGEVDNEDKSKTDSDKTVTPEYSKVVKKSKSSTSEVSADGWIKSGAVVNRKSQVFDKEETDLKHSSDKQTSQEANRQTDFDSKKDDESDDYFDFEMNGGASAPASLAELTVEKRLNDGGDSSNGHGDDNEYAPFPMKDESEGASSSVGVARSKNEMYACAAQASSLPASPKPPKRLDSLMNKNDEEVDEDYTEAESDKKTESKPSTLENVSTVDVRPAPARRMLVSKSVYVSGKSAPETINKATPASILYDNIPRKTAAGEIPPLPPRRGMAGMALDKGGSDVTASGGAVAGRKVQSYRMSPQSSISEDEPASPTRLRGVSERSSAPVSRHQVL